MSEDTEPKAHKKAHKKHDEDEPETTVDTNASPDSEDTGTSSKPEISETADKPEIDSDTAETTMPNTEAGEAPEEAAPAEETPSENEPAQETEVSNPVVVGASVAKPKRKFLSRKVLLIVLAVLGALVILGAVTVFTPLGYSVYSFRQQDAKITVTDEYFNEPLSKVDITINGTKQTLDGESPYTIKLKPGKQTIKISKQYYEEKEINLTVKPFFGKVDEQAVSLKPTGIPVSIEIKHTINKDNLKDATLKYGESEVKTGEDGTAVAVLPADQEEIEATLSKEGFNEIKVKIKVPARDAKEEDRTFAYTLTPTGKIYFLSKRTGKVDVMKSNLDGTDQAVVLAATGNEDQNDTQLLASTDWKYLALKSRREGKYSKVYIINTQDDKLVAADEGEATFQTYGWIDHNFVYFVNRDVLPQNEKNRLKSYNADTNKITLIDKSEYKTFAGVGPGRYGGGYWYTDRTLEQSFSSVILADKQIHYSKVYYGTGDPNFDGKDQFISVNPDGSNRKVVHEVDNRTTISTLDAYLWNPHEIYIRQGNSPNPALKYLEYALGSSPRLSEVTAADEIRKFEDLNYPTYLESPSNKSTFWSEQRDGRSVMFVGNTGGEDGKEVANLQEFNTFGWFTDDYLLVSKKSSELFILPVKGGEPIKITDYHRPAYDLRGYGGGYGGL